VEDFTFRWKFGFSAGDFIFQQVFLISSRCFVFPAEDFFSRWKIYSPLDFLFFRLIFEISG
jgi:hypothetical protein